MHRMALFGMAALLAWLTVFIPAAAQDEVTISLAVNTFSADIFEERIIPEFEAQHPGIKVHLVELDTFSSPLNPADAVEDYLDDAAEYLSRADVVSIDSSVQRTLTRAGYLLDLSPLADTDAALNAADFYPGALNALRWDGGLWALPITADVLQVYYDRQAFDEAGLAYPNANWTIADYTNAIRALTDLDASGAAVEIAVRFISEARDYFWASFAGDVLDDGVLPNVPDYSNPVLHDVISEWVRLDQDNYLTQGSQGMAIAIGGEPEPDPLTISTTVYLFIGENQQHRIGAAPLPGNQAIVTANGYGVSSGTRYPDAAYALVKFLSSSPDAVSMDFNGRAARRSMGDAASSDTGGRGMRFSMSGMLPPDVEASIVAGLETGRPASDFAFADGLAEAIELVIAGSTTPEMALQQVEDTVITDLTAAEARRSSPLVVDAPPAPIVLAAGEVALNFAVVSNISPLPNRELWNQLAAEFAAQDPQVGAVTVSGELPFGRNGLVDFNGEFDCYVTSNNPLTSVGTDGLLSLDPLLQSDMTFNPTDLYGGVLAQVQENGMTWGIPLTLSVDALDYDPALFAAAGVPLPTAGWTVSEFELALRMLLEYTGETPLVASTLNTTYLSALIAAYGGVPYDTVTTPVTLRYDDPASVAAIQQVLDLVVAGYLSYEPFTGTRASFNFGEVQASAISTASLGQGNFGRTMAVIAIGSPDDGQSSAPVRHYVPYPLGTSLNGASYSVTAGFVSATSANAEPCYRWLRFVSQYPDLFEGMPVSRQLANDPALEATVGSEKAAFYRSYGALLDNPTTRIIDPIPPSFGIPSEAYWLFKVFDDYVAAEGDLDLAAALADAQTKATAYLECAGDVLPTNPFSVLQPEELSRMGELARNCSIAADPATAAMFQ